MREPGSGIAALLRREASRSRTEVSAPTLQCGHLALDSERLELTYQDQKIEVTVTEFRLLEVLAGRPGTVFSRSRILDLIRGDDVVVTDRVVDTYVRRLRRKLERVDPEFPN
jgi:DNA-binding response OmpR family regulator